MKEFRLVENPQLCNPDDAFVAHLSNVHNKEELLRQLFIKLRFPDYFGFNWDALYDCLRDFDWLEQENCIDTR
jgi:hypothetical protein